MVLCIPVFVLCNKMLTFRLYKKKKNTNLGLNFAPTKGINDEIIPTLQNLPINLRA